LGNTSGEGSSFRTQLWGAIFGSNFGEKLSAALGNSFGQNFGEQRSAGEQPALGRNFEEHLCAAALKNRSFVEQFWGAAFGSRFGE